MEQRVAMEADDIDVAACGRQRGQKRFDRRRVRIGQVSLQLREIVSRTVRERARPDPAAPARPSHTAPSRTGRSS